MGSRSEEEAVDSKAVGVVVIVAGVIAILLGVLVYFGWLSWFGHLPGDIRIESDSTKVYVPITTMILVSVLLSLVVWVVRRFIL